MRGDDATSSITSLVQSIGSTELMRTFSIAVCSRIARSIAAKFMRGDKVAPPASKVDARQHDLAIAVGDQRVHFAQHLLQLQRAAPAAYVRE